MLKKLYTALGTFVLILLITNIYLFREFSSLSHQNVVNADVGQIKLHEIGDAGSSDIAVNSSGGGVIVWHQQVENNFNIYAQRINNNGEKVGDIFKVNQCDLSDQKFPKVAINSSGDFVVVWQSYGQDSDRSGIYGQKFMADGSRFASEFKVNTFIAGNQLLPDVAMRNNGSFVVAWVSEYRDKTFKSIYAQFFNEECALMGGEIPVNVTKKGIQTNPALAVNPKGQVLITWQSNLNQETGWDVYAQLLNFEGERFLKDDLLVSASAEHDQTHPDVTHNNYGNFIVVWSHAEPFLKLSGLLKENISGQIISSNGERNGNGFTLQPSLGHHKHPSISYSGSGYTVVWQNFERNEWRINMQNLSSTGMPDDVIIALNADLKVTINSGLSTETDEDLAREFKENPELFKGILWINDLESEDRAKCNLNPVVSVDSFGNKNVVWTFYGKGADKKIILYKQVNKVNNPIVISLGEESEYPDWMFTKGEVDIEKVYWFAKGVKTDDIVVAERPEEEIIVENSMEEEPIKEPLLALFEASAARVAEEAAEELTNEPPEEPIFFSAEEQYEFMVLELLELWEEPGVRTASGFSRFWASYHQIIEDHWEPGYKTIWDLVDWSITLEWDESEWNLFWSSYYKAVEEFWS